MDAGTVTLVIYLAGMGPAPRGPFLDLWIRFPDMPRVYAPLRHPLVVPMRSMQACLQVAERERARGNKAGCNRVRDLVPPGDFWPLHEG
jgi:hypothetical protein